jgi:tRNA threonylcarbamoyladenosine biosynthesis protein TsaB
MLLAIDTATRTASVALFDEQGVCGEATWRARENHTTSLMPEVTRLMRLGGVTTEALDAVAVATGPGSFTGLRIGLSLAKGLALARGLPLIGIPTLDGLAQAFAQQPLPLWALIEAGRGRYVSGYYHPRGSQVERTGDYVIGRAEALIVNIGARLDQSTDGVATARVLVCGEVDANLRATLLAQLPGRVVLANPAASVRRAGYLAELAWQRWQTNQVSALDTLAPYYIPTASLPQTTG